ncbi:MAG: T9SS type A sorting domain-containing protein [Ignavibacteriaceae bacterium]|nr:T9SS type A sorting domain-containing protein [Ignavibacteriaceae bacterium]HRN25426.1 alpha/beta hydrolase-fold protein [Ignavibacteriaceae bacterium]HRP91580.1 alpha/beta hydrolase-fold protein [Ignavibacteriaceae bacterium]HRQ53190.1 alpha/beta hydrolase-fold protein [Ignavibacteriaceae bacterium]
MKKLLFALVLLLTPIIYSQSLFQQFVNHVNSLSDPAQKTAAVDSFMIYARTVGIPFIEDSTVNFIYRGNVTSVAAAGDFNGWSQNSWLLTKLSQTNFWYRTQTFELDARLDYKFVLNGNNWILDPENPHTCSGGFGPNSELSMPLYIQPWEIQYNANIPHGTLTTKILYSTNVGTNYQLNIYLPPGYDTLSTESYPTVYFQDGAEYISLGSAVKVIDNLLDSNKIQPVIAVFVTPNNRNEEYAGTKRDQYRLFFVDELVPYIDANYKTKLDPKKRIVLGDSFGGNISALISYNHPEVFGLCGLHSAAFWANNYEAYNLITNGPVKDIKWNSIWGTYESLYTNMRDFRDYLNSVNSEIEWLERPEGHSWGLWRANIDRILEYFFPESATNLIPEKNYSVSEFQLYQNYPNPFNPSTIISWQSPVSSHQTLKIYDVLGNELVTLVDEFKPAGMYEVEFDIEQESFPAMASGVYFYRFQAGDFFETRKMIYLK